VTGSEKAPALIQDYKDYNTDKTVRFIVQVTDPCYLAVFRIHDILMWIRIRGSMPLMDSDPDPSIFITDLQDANKKLIFLKKFSCILLF
jgi:hypothetical protein